MISSYMKCPFDLNIIKSKDTIGLHLRVIRVIIDFIAFKKPLNCRFWVAMSVTSQISCHSNGHGLLFFRSFQEIWWCGQNV